MGHLVAFMFVIGGILASALSKQVADEFKAWTPWLTNRLIEFSVSRRTSSNDTEKSGLGTLKILPVKSGSIRSNLALSRSA